MCEQLWQILRTLCATVLISASPLSAANWNLSAATNVVIDSTGVPISELSGVTYQGPSTDANHYQFLAVQDEGGKLVHLDVELSAAGQLIAAKATASLTVASSLDFEGVAFTSETRNSVFLSEENSPGVREYNLSTGAELQSVTIPSVFGNRRSNFGFESLARNPAGNTMWTGNEEALTVDGPRATSTAGTTVRLLKLDVDGNAVTAAAQYAYEVEPIHAAGFASQRRSGLVDLVALPDGGLLALERSFELSLTAPLYLSRIYEVDYMAATDISVAPFDTGLVGHTYTPVGKTLLASGQVGGGSGQNLEGLTLGPRLANGNWVLVGVVDNSDGADGVSLNTLVTFELSPNPTADFDQDGEVDGRDFLSWQRGFGTTIGAKLSDGDADRDGDVDAEDLVIWSADYGTSIVMIQTIPEPETPGLLVATLLFGLARRNLAYIVSLAW